MKELIYIYDEPLEPESSTIEKEAQLSGSTKAIVGGLLSAASSVLPPLAASSAARNIGFAALGANPISLVLALAVTSGPLVYTLYKSKGKELSPAETELLESEINDLKITRSKARELGLTFPPGHPKSGLLYQRHPLASYVSCKQSYYIPEQQYESILTEERQSELIRLLTELGATKIEISESYALERDNNSSVSVDGKGDSFELDVTKKNDSNQILSNKLLRSFKLIGKKWASNQELNTNLFNWFGFEPQWQSLVYTRTYGGCIEATIEMHEEQSLISGSELALALKSDLSVSIEGSSQVGVKSKHNKSYVIQIEFGVPEAHT